MDKSRMTRLMALFERALELAPGQRAAFVAQLTGDDAPFRQELESLLDAHDSSADYFEELAEQLVSPAYASVIRSARRAREVALLPRLQAELGERYRFLQGLGGGMSRVFLAEEVRLGRKVVIKVLPPEMAATANAARFRREIQLAAQLQHPHIVPVLTSDSTDSLLYYTMPFVAGESLRDRLARDGPLPVADALRIWRDVLDALSHAHRHGVVHGDIKPENILLGEGNAVVSDFGIARAIEVAGGPQGESSGLAIGTPAYMAPEQLRGDETADHRADIYAAGLVMYEMVEGRLPFPGETVHDVAQARLTSEPARLTRQECPRAVADLVMRCLALEPADRIRSADAVLSALEGPPSEVPPPARPRRVRRATVWIVAAFALLTASLGVRQVLGAREEISIRRYTTNVEAWEWYRRGTDLALMRSAEGRVQALDYLNRAIAADSNFAAAYAALVHVYVNEAGNAPGSEHQAFALAGRAARKAYALDSTLAESHVALGWSHLVLRNWVSSEASFKRGIAINPRAPRGLEGLARLYLWTGRSADQIITARKALDVEPFSHSAIREMALALAGNGRCEEAIELLRQLRSLTPRVGVAGVIAGQCYAAKEMWPEALAEFQWAMETRGGARTALSFYAYVLARAGNADSATAILSDLLSGARYSHGAFGIATVYAGLGDYDQAFTWLERSVVENSVRPYLMGPMFDHVRRDARFARVRQQLGL
jgi:tetratricopeptide (TPR) repeat protein